MSTDTHTHARTRRISAPAYYQGRPAALWPALAPRSTTRKSPRTSCASEGALVVSDNI